MQTPTVGSLFAGIGGFDLGFERAGFEVRWQVENDDYCNRVLAKHWPNVKRYGDIRDVQGSELEPVDVICGGFPCQDISNSGGKAGLEGERSGLWHEMLRLVCQVGPRYVVVENVGGLVDRGLSGVLSGLAEAGLDAEWGVLSSADFGADHERARQIIVAYPAGERQQKSRINWAHPRDNKAETYREANRLVNAIRRDALPFVCERHDGVPARLATQQLTALGNAIDPNVAEWIACRVREALELESTHAA